MAKALLIVVGILSIVAGFIALLNPFPATLAATFIAGWSFLILGLIELFAVFRTDTWGGRIWALLLGGITVLVGIQILGNPLGGALALTFVIGILFLASGVVKVITGLTMKGVQFRWLIVLSGVVSVILGFMILSNFPVSAAGVLGILLGIELISNGIAALAIAMSREVPEKAAA
ncbi:MAG: DUF308 domain-containing protein [Sedimentitalea sp.]|nr:DUF308 domain-containing protein [Sedimentitalea sp.]